MVKTYTHEQKLSLWGKWLEAFLRSPYTEGKVWETNEGGYVLHSIYLTDSHVFRRNTSLLASYFSFNGCIS